MIYTLTQPLQVSNGDNLPIAGEALRLALPGHLINQISGLVASQMSEHTVFVKSSLVDVALGAVRLELWVAQPGLKGRSSVEKFLSWPMLVRGHWVPLPYEPLPDAQKVWTHTQTPPRFGAPLWVGGWSASGLSWLGALSVEVEVPFTKSFRRFEPQVKLSVPEIIQLHTYERLLRGVRTGYVLTPPPSDCNSSGRIDDSRVSWADIAKGVPNPLTVGKEQKVIPADSVLELDMSTYSDPQIQRIQRWADGVL